MPENQISSQYICSSCQTGKVPNVDKSSCVEKCEIGFLNPVGTFCIEFCTNGYYIDNYNRQCKPCADINPNSIWDTPSQQCKCNEQTIGNFPDCSLCFSGKIPNEYKTECVIQNCGSQFLNIAETECISSCDLEQAVSISGKCKPCSYVDDLSIWTDTRCECVEYSSKIQSACSCNTNFEKLGNTCVCPQDKYISSDKTQCLEQCPLENIKDGIFCKICSEGKVPNVGKTNCVENTCEPSYLNSAGTFCIENCLKEYAPDSNRQCKLCSIVNQYGIWDQNEQKCICGEQIVGVFPVCKLCNEQVQISVYSNGKCICGEGTSGEYPKCECLKNYEKRFQKCICSRKLTLDNQCVDQCHIGQVFLNGATHCSKCQNNKVANYDQTECVEMDSCAPYFLNIEQNQCVIECEANAEPASNLCQCSYGFFIIGNICQQPQIKTTCSQNIFMSFGILNFCVKNEILSNSMLSKNITFISQTFSKQTFFRSFNKIQNSNINLNVEFGTSPFSLSYSSISQILQSSIQIACGGSGQYFISFKGSSTILFCNLSFIQFGSEAGLIQQGQISLQKSTLRFTGIRFNNQNLVVRKSIIIINGEITEEFGK
ncbi:extracellular_matrix protein [Hexamita inflata]|uniref:Extracellular matrix protein n=1 Tax=Hexamita inflata TaxID=28002 RepID=A0AA86QKG0_9EUKA|nr:extracellular matrix protein [Hexamita inflata]